MVFLEKSDILVRNCLNLLVLGITVNCYRNLNNESKKIAKKE